MPLAKTYYLIDFENVHEDGLTGSQTLGSQDYVHLFSTRNAPKISIQKLTSFNAVNLFSHEIPVGRQSLDMHLVSFLGYLIGTEGKDCRYVIVSKDTDYDNIISFWKGKGVSQIGRQDKILVPPKKAPRPAAKQAPRQAAVSDASRKRSQLNTQIQRAVSGAGFAQPTISRVASTAVKYFGKEGFEELVYQELKENCPEYEELCGIIIPILAEYAGGEEKSAPASAAKKEGKSPAKKPSAKKENAPEKAQKAAPEKSRLSHMFSRISRGRGKTAVSSSENGKEKSGK